MHGDWGGTVGVTPFGKGHKVIKTVKACKYCNKYKEPIVLQTDQVYALITEKAEKAHQQKTKNHEIKT